MLMYGILNFRGQDKIKLVVLGEAVNIEFISFFYCLVFLIMILTRARLGSHRKNCYKFEINWEKQNDSVDVLD